MPRRKPRGNLQKTFEFERRLASELLEEEGGEFDWVIGEGNDLFRWKETGVTVVFYARWHEGAWHVWIRDQRSRNIRGFVRMVHLLQAGARAEEMPDEDEPFFMYHCKAMEELSNDD